MSDMDTNGNSQDSRITSLEQLTEALHRAQQNLLTAQVILVDRQGTLEKNIAQLVESQKRTDAQMAATDAKIAALADRQKGFDERVDKLVSAIGEWIGR